MQKESFENKKWSRKGDQEPNKENIRPQVNQSNEEMGKKSSNEYGLEETTKQSLHSVFSGEKDMETKSMFAGCPKPKEVLNKTSPFEHNLWTKRKLKFTSPTSGNLSDLTTKTQTTVEQEKSPSPTASILQKNVASDQKHQMEATQNNSSFTPSEISSSRRRHHHRTGSFAGPMSIRSPFEAPKNEREREDSNLMDSRKDSSIFQFKEDEYQVPPKESTQGQEDKREIEFSFKAKKSDGTILPRNSPLIRVPQRLSPPKWPKTQESQAFQPSDNNRHNPETANVSSRLRSLSQNCRNDPREDLLKIKKNQSAYNKQLFRELVKNEMGRIQKSMKHQRSFIQKKYLENSSGLDDLENQKTLLSVCKFEREFRQETLKRLLKVLGIFERCEKPEDRLIVSRKVPRH